MNDLAKYIEKAKPEVRQWLDKMITGSAEYDGPPHEISKNAKLEIIWLDASGKPTGPEPGNLNPAEKAFFRRNNQMITEWRKTDTRLAQRLGRMYLTISSDSIIRAGDADLKLTNRKIYP